MLVLDITAPFIYYQIEHAYDHTFILSDKIYWAIFGEGFKISLGVVMVFITTLIITNRWQQRTISFSMIQELNSKDFYEVRSHLRVKMAKCLHDKTDIDHISEWFPYSPTYLEKLINKSEPVNMTADENWEDHALVNMAYFAVRFYNYDKCGMINRKLTTHLFHFFFHTMKFFCLNLLKALFYIEKNWQVQDTSLTIGGI